MGHIILNTFLLPTKFTLPPARNSLVARPALLARFWPAPPLTVVCAPAGYGKTTLVSEFIRATRAKPSAPDCVWLALDPEDDDATRFLINLILACQSARPGFAPELLATAQTAPTTAFWNLFERLIQYLEAASSAVTIVLEDYHCLKTPILHEALGRLLERCPVQLRFILTTRIEPPLPLARLRARAQLTEITAADLRFTAAEATDFLRRVMGLTLSAEQVALLEQHTEGWIAGLQLAAASLSAHTPPQALITHLSGEQRVLADYLITEFFNQQPTSTQTFLLATAVTEKFCAPLCAALLPVLQDQGAEIPLVPASAWQAFIENLERQNLLIAPCDEKRLWWRYHPLLLDVLRARLRQRWLEQCPQLHAQAAAWFERHGHAVEAVFHAFQAEDVEYSARLITQFAPTFIKQADFATLRQWLARLPQATLWQHPRLCLTQTWLLLDLNQPEQALPYLAQVNTLLAHHTEPALQAEALTLRAISEAMNNRAEAALELAQQAQNLNVTADALTRALVAYGLGAAYKMGQDGLRAEHCLREAGLAALAAGNTYLAVEASGNLGDLLVDLGRLPEAEQSLRHTLEQAHTHLGFEHPATGWLYWDLARIHFEWDDLISAQADLEQSLRLCTVWGNAAILVRAHLLQAQVQQTQHQWLEIQATLDEAEHIAQRANLQALRHMVTRRRILVALAQGNLPVAQMLAEGLQATSTEPIPYHLAYVMARLNLAQGQPARALEYLKHTWQALEKTNLVISRIQVLLTEALARRALGQREQALLPLERALVMAQPGGFRRSFLEHGVPMHELLRRTAPHSAVPVYAQSLLAAFQVKPAHQPALQLTRREQQILRLLAAGLSNRQMAEQLVITEATLKRHLSNLYLKLSAHSRTHALARATELSLL